MHRRIRWSYPLGSPLASVVRHTSVRQPGTAATDRSRRPRSGPRDRLSADLRPPRRQAGRRGGALSRSALSLCARRTLWFAEAADVGLGIELEITAVRRAVQSLEWLNPSITLGVNVSPETCCSPELSEQLDIVPADRLVLEITENAPVLDYERLANALAPLRARGVRLAIDDTCSGYAEPSPRPPPPAGHDQARYHPHAWRRDGYRTPSVGRSARRIRAERRSRGARRGHRERAISFAA